MILDFQLGEVGQAGIVPRFIFFNTNDTIATVTTAGYLNKFVAQGNIISETDMAVVVTRATPNATAAQVSLFDVSYSGGDWSLSSNSTPLTLNNGQIYVGNASNVATGVTMSGDATVSNTGVLTIANNAIDLAMLSSGITPSHVVKFASQVTTVGSAAAEAFTVNGVLDTDLAFVQVVNDGTANVTVLQAVCTADTLTVTFSADPGNDTVINYQILRAAS